MARRSAAVARSAAPARRSRTAGERSRSRPPRRVSGPAHRTSARPRRRGVARVLRAPAARALRARGAGVLDALLHGRGWIGLVGVLLVGIVFLNVTRLELNRGIAQGDERAAALERANARWRLLDARLSSSERIQRLAEQRGMMLPAPGDVHYVRLRPRLDDRLAARRATPPGGAVQTASLPAPATQAPPAASPAAPAPSSSPTAQGPAAGVTPPTQSGSGSPSLATAPSSPGQG